ncbi:MAG: ATP-binding protein [Alphaproteobacteria bacterium]|nr:ATP-binding protein [Alphaproteobacteria bacterium]
MLGQEISTLFDGAPVDEEDLFAGRAAEIRKIIEAVLSRSTHVVLFGEKGVGKTSLANVFWKRFNRTLRSLIIARIQAGPNDTFSSLWGRALEELHAAGASSGKPEYVDFDYDQETWTPSKIRRELQKCAANALPIIVIDEYSELADPDARKLTAHLIKEFYDFSVTTTVILVGVAENISELIEDHQSIDRAIVEIQLGRMSNTELTEIIRSRCARTVMTFTPNAISTINVLSRGLPYFTQTLSRHAALHTIDNRRIEVTENDVDASMGRFIENSQRSFREMYQTAIRSNQSNFFAQSLLACALAKADDDGFFTANDIVEPYSEIMKDRKRIAHFDKHLLRFSSDGGGNILTRRGSARKQQFRFSNPMMQAYVIIHGIRDGLIPDEARAVLLRHD